MKKLYPITLGEFVKGPRHDGVVKSSRSRRRESRDPRRAYSTPQGQRDETQRRYWTFYGAATLLLCFLLVGLSAEAPAQENAGASPAPYGQAVKLIAQKEFDAAIRLLEGPAAEDPYKFEPNWMLATALLEKCEEMKAVGNTAYHHVVKRPYEIGLRLFKAQPSRPEPYYLIARSLTLNERPHKAGKYILKAIFFSSPQHPNYPEFQMVLGDSWTGQMLQGNSRGYANARQAYQTARELRLDDPDFAARIERRMEYLESRHK